ncbi:uncharacterized protein CDAR_416051 [Caerostris darwini]|uniref:Gustatory receptor n=1 Tax=Caerostris darwini TaxID=1538125 RepID=A0AAV4ULR4_9ARAC|nr:uncharacterized protein CDAR_416051 [Caerostris darwini]
MNRYSIYVKRTRITSLLKAFGRVQKSHKVKLAKYKLITNIVTLLYLLFCLCYFSSVIIVLCIDEYESENWFEDLTFHSNIAVSLPIKVSFNIAYIVLTRLFRVVSPLFLTAFYIHWCLILNRLTKQCAEELRISVQTSNKKRIVHNFIRNYNKLHGLAVMTESALSVEIFWLMASHFTIVFGMLSKVLGFFGYIDIILDLENSVFATIDCISFFAIIFFASRIHREDEKVRDQVREVIFQLSLAKDSTESSKLLLRFIQSKRQLVLTAGGIFEFTKSFLFTSAGVLITYNLLILQLNTPSL